jgi:hypothetical protein
MLQLVTVDPIGIVVVDMLSMSNCTLGVFIPWVDPWVVEVYNEGVVVSDEVSFVSVALVSV